MIIVSRKPTRSDLNNSLEQARSQLRLLWIDGMPHCGKSASDWFNLFNVHWDFIFIAIQLIVSQILLLFFVKINSSSTQTTYQFSEPHFIVNKTVYQQLILLPFSLFYGSNLKNDWEIVMSPD